MSLFFDVLTTKGFVLASDVMHSRTDARGYAHKLDRSPPNSPVPCAIATCGDYFSSSLSHFRSAVARKDTLRSIAQAFAEQWTERYAGTEDYSAVHLVGFEKIPHTGRTVPQMWFWSNWAANPDHYLTEDELRLQLGTFVDPIPFNDHIPQLVRRHTRRFPSSLTDERELVISFVHQLEPLFTWNGDTTFWRSAAAAVASVMTLLRPGRDSWDLDTTWHLAETALRFLADVGTFLPTSSVALSPKRECDVLIVTPDAVQDASWPELPDDT